MERGGIHDGVVVSAPFHMRQELGNDKAAWRRNDMLLEGKPTEVVHLLEGLVRGVEPGDVGLHPAPGTGVCVAGGLELLAGKFAEVVPVIFRIQQNRAVRGVFRSTDCQCSGKQERACQKQGKAQMHWQNNCNWKVDESSIK